MTIEDSKPALVWHYTSTDGFMGAISTHVLWATSAALMNDGAELRTGQELVKRYADTLTDHEDMKIVKRMEDAGYFEQRVRYDEFLLSASEAGDSLTLWRNYALGTVPYALGLDRSATLVPVLNTDHAVATPGKWDNVAYVSSHLDKAVAAAYKPTADMFREVPPDGPVLWWPFGHSKLNLLKHAAFADEREVRYLAWAMPSEALSFRSSRFGVTPYVGLTSQGSDKNGLPEMWTRHASRLPLREVMIGPSQFQAESAATAKMFLAAHGYRNVVVRLSDAPYR